jgi:hypothetical protein
MGQVAKSSPADEFVAIRSSLEFAGCFECSGLLVLVVLWE